MPVLIFLMLSVVLAMFGCQSGNDPDGTVRNSQIVIPHGYMDRLEQIHEGRMIGFGPFVGYYLRPYDPDDLSRLRFVCFNENQFYSSNMADGAKLYEGIAVRTTLPEAGMTIPAKDRINPVFFQDAPDVWLDSRPAPQNEFLHFHSCYSGTGPVLTGYWIRHEAVADFIYDMGGRVEKDSPLYHHVKKGLDLNFARIIEFDAGPERP